ADGVARHHGDARFGQIPDLPLEVQDVEARDLVVAYVPPVTPHLLVAAGAEGLGARAGQDYDADIAVLPGIGKRVHHFHDRQRSERVAHVGAVESDLRDPLGLFIQDVGVRLGGLPLDGRHVTSTSLPGILSGNPPGIRLRPAVALEPAHVPARYACARTRAPAPRTLGAAPRAPRGLPRRRWPFPPGASVPPFPPQAAGTFRPAHRL